MLFFTELLYSARGVKCKTKTGGEGGHPHSTPHIHIPLLPSLSLSLSLWALNRIRASYAKWNV